MQVDQQDGAVRRQPRPDCFAFQGSIRVTRGGTIILELNPLSFGIDLQSAKYNTVWVRLGDHMDRESFQNAPSDVIATE